MPAPLNPNLWPSVLHDEDGVPISASNPLPTTSSFTVTPGTTIETPANTPVAAAATEPLPVAPAGTRRVRVQVTGGDENTEVLIRELGGAAGEGILLVNNGSTLYGGADGAIADLEAENIAGPDVVVRVQFEEN